jgi:hypothetical protein
VPARNEEGELARSPGVEDAHRQVQRSAMAEPFGGRPRRGTGKREAGDVEALARTAEVSAVGRRPAAEQAHSRKIWGF